MAIHGKFLALSPHPLEENKELPQPLMDSCKTACPSKMASGSRDRSHLHNVGKESGSPDHLENS